MKKILFISLICLLCNQSKALSVEFANQNVNASLGEILEISKIIVEGVEHDKGGTLHNMQKKELTTINRNLKTLTLSPIKVKIHTNISTPISISAEFQELNHNNNLHNFKTESLSFSPKTITINKPYDNVVSDEFIPKLEIDSAVKSGAYTGQILFTLGVI